MVAMDKTHRFALSCPKGPSSLRIPASARNETAGVSATASEGVRLSSLQLQASRILIETRRETEIDVAPLISAT